MELFMKDNICKGKKTAKDNFSGKMEINIKANFFTMNCKDLEYFSGQMNADMKAIGKKAKWMVLVSLPERIDKNI